MQGNICDYYRNHAMHKFAVAVVIMQQCAAAVDFFLCTYCFHQASSIFNSSCDGNGGLRIKSFCLAVADQQCLYVALYTCIYLIMFVTI